MKRHLVAVVAASLAGACASSVTTARLLPSHSPHGEALWAWPPQGPRVRGELLTVTPTGMLLLGDSLRFVRWESTSNIYLLSACKTLWLSGRAPDSTARALLTALSRGPATPDSATAMTQWSRVPSHRVAEPVERCGVLGTGASRSPHYDPPAARPPQ